MIIHSYLGNDNIRLQLTLWSPLWKSLNPWKVHLKHIKGSQPEEPGWWFYSFLKPNLLNPGRPGFKNWILWRLISRVGGTQTWKNCDILTKGWIQIVCVLPKKAVNFTQICFFEDCECHWIQKNIGCMYLSQYISRIGTNICMRLYPLRGLVELVIFCLDFWWLKAAYTSPAEMNRWILNTWTSLEVPQSFCWKISLGGARLHLDSTTVLVWNILHFGKLT